MNAPIRCGRWWPLFERGLLLALADGGRRQVTARAAVRAQVENAARAFSAAPDRERRWVGGGQAVWPEFQRSYWEVFAELREQLDAGERIGDEGAVLRWAPGPGDVDRAVPTLEWVRAACARSRNPRRDLDIVWLMAAGAEGAKVARRFGLDRTAPAVTRERVFARMLQHIGVSPDHRFAA